MPEKLKIFLYTLAPLAMIFFAWIIHVIVSHNISSDNSTTRVLYLTLNCLTFLSQGFIMGAVVKTRLKNASLQMIISGCLCIVLFMLFFNLSAVSFSSIPESIDDFISAYGYMAFIWSGIYLYNIFASYRRIQ